MLDRSDYNLEGGSHRSQVCYVVARCSALILLPTIRLSAVAIFMWRLRGFVDELTTRVEAIHSQTTNHIPTLLTSIDKSLAILVDRFK